MGSWYCLGRRISDSKFTKAGCSYFEDSYSIALYGTFLDFYELIRRALLFPKIGTDFPFFMACSFELFLNGFRSCLR